MRFAIMGSGGLGCLFGGVLARSGTDVTLISRGANLAALRECGLDVTLVGAEPFHVDVRATGDPGEVGPVDAILFCVKTYDIETAARQLLPMIGPGTLVLPVQNGVEAAEQIAAVVGEDHVVTGVGVSGGTLERPGVIVQKAGEVRAKFGPDRLTDGRRAGEIRDSLSAGGIKAEVSLDVERALWEKFLVAVVGLGFLSMNRLPLGPTLACPEAAEVVLGIIKETVAVGRARGVQLPDDTAERTLAWMQDIAGRAPSIRGSMYYDLIAGKRLELDAVTGAVVRMGRESSIPTPFNQVVYAVLKPYVDGAPTLPA